jgi:hypothetical protein
MSALPRLFFNAVDLEGFDNVIFEGCIAEDSFGRVDGTEERSDMIW